MQQICSLLAGCSRPVTPFPTLLSRKGKEPWEQSARMTNGARQRQVTQRDSFHSGNDVHVTCRGNRLISRTRCHLISSAVELPLSLWFPPPLFFATFLLPGSILVLLEPPESQGRTMFSSAFTKKTLAGLHCQCELNELARPAPLSHLILSLVNVSLVPSIDRPLATPCPVERKAQYLCPNFASMPCFATER